MSNGRSWESSVAAFAVALRRCKFSVRGKVLSAVRGTVLPCYAEMVITAVQVSTNLTP